jgi:hypothetical protein
MPSTYEPIATTTLASTNSQITFSSIPNTYTDLRLVFLGTGQSTYVSLRFNGSASTYSNTDFRLQGTSVGSERRTSSSEINSGSGGPSTANNPILVTYDIMGYRQTAAFKPVIMKTASSSGATDGHVDIVSGVWHSLSAINQVQVFGFGGSFDAGTIATLYGIKAA